ncbi:MAG: mechanosensitive ion channel family protein [Victivallales bacterium]|nr:mechanosensitive ion channel family protein [Victivallales bacterium]
MPEPVVPTEAAAETIEKTGEAIQNTAPVFNRQEVFDQLTKGDVKGVWEKLWQSLQGEVWHFGKIILLAAVIIIIAYFINKLIHKAFNKVAEKYDLDVSLASIINRIITLLMMTFTLLIILELLGINTASVLTVVGAAGLAVGLALKDTLSNIAAGIFLLTQHPYKTGDFVECAGMSGSILEIGLFTTKLRTPQGQDIFVPNNSIIAAPITNYSSNKVRRADITVGIDYGDNLEKGVKVLQELMDSNELILKDPAPVVLVSELADSSVNLTLRFWTENAKYWDAYWAIQRNLKPAIEGAGLNIPFPQRVVTFANKAE